IDGQTEDGVARIAENLLFSVGLRFRVERKGIDLVGFSVTTAASIEDKVGRQEEKRDGVRQFAEVTRSRNVEETRPFRLRLGRWSPAQGGAMNDRIGLIGCKGAFHGREIFQSKTRARQRHDSTREQWRHSVLNQVMANKTSGAGDPDHCGALV